MTNTKDTYTMTLSLSVLQHLGLRLYSNVAAVLSEVVANAWDADAENVAIAINTDAETITIEDDGHGMTVDDANKKYLNVGYERRKDAAHTPHFNRPVMGRKGIGKLSLFSIARTVEIHSIKDDVKHGFIMDSDEIEAKIKNQDQGDYHPDPVVDLARVDIQRGTRITLTNMKRKLQWTEKALRRRLARRFSVIGPDSNFAIQINGEPITIEDREYHDKLQFVWTFDEGNPWRQDTPMNPENSEQRAGDIPGYPDYSIKGWIGTASESGKLKDSDTSESINKIIVMVRGKLAKEDILEEFGEGGLYTKYVFGEIHADFLDLDTAEDIATTSRQSINEEDPRYQALKEKLSVELKYIQSRWTALRNERGSKQALAFPQIEEWFGELDADQKGAAQRLFGRINQLPIEDFDHKRQLFVSGVLAFESLKLRNMLHRLEEVSTENLEALNQVFIQLNDLEASAYYQIAKDRLEVIRKLTNLVDDNAKERALQEHLYQHLWLLDASWERATHTKTMEKNITDALAGVYSSLNDEQKRSRLDIAYSTTGNRHVIIELKRAERVLTTTDLYGQIARYFSAAEKVLRDAGKGSEPLEIVCVVGKRLRDWDESPSGESRSRESLRALHARVVRYDELIENALQAYQDYVDRGEAVGRVYRLIQEISTQDAEAISPRSD